MAIERLAWHRPLNVAEIERALDIERELDGERALDREHALDRERALREEQGLDSLSGSLRPASHVAHP
jgi:hypothetical protein